MRPFSKKEAKGVGIILALIIVTSLYNFRISLRRARDAQRKSDVGSVSGALEKYQSDFGYFPFNSTDGSMKACKPEKYEELLQAASGPQGFDSVTYMQGLALCEWGRDALVDVADPDYPPYLANLPVDPKANLGISYVYLSNGNRFQLYAYLEGGQAEEGFREEIVARKINCGAKICNFGKAYSNTPLDKSIEEYEKELMEKEKLK